MLKKNEYAILCFLSHYVIINNKLYFIDYETPNMDILVVQC